MADVKSLTDLFVYELRRVYDAEQRLSKALSRLAGAVSSSELKQAAQSHFEETEAHVDRVEQIFELLDQKPKADTSDAIKGAIKEIEDMLDLDADSAIRDAGLIAAVQEAEHLEIAIYGTLRTWAVVLNHKEIMQILELTLEEEKSADARLTQIANSLNTLAASAPRV
jgi:ferritin-like metal-binding protein YciE